MPVRMTRMYYCEKCGYKRLHTRGDVLPPLPPSVCPKCKQALKSKTPGVLDFLNLQVLFDMIKNGNRF